MPTNYQLRFYKIGFFSLFFVLFCSWLSFGYYFYLQYNKNAKATGISASEVFELVNQTRQSHDLTPLNQNQNLTAAAESKAADMRNNNYFAHYRPSDQKRGLQFIAETGYKYQMAGENLAVYYENPQDLLEGWMQSPTHRQNILNPQISESGIGVVTGNFDGFDTFFVVQFFALPVQQANVPQAVQTPTALPTAPQTTQTDQQNDQQSMPTVPTIEVPIDNSTDGQIVNSDLTTSVSVDEVLSNNSGNSQNSCK